MTVEELALRLDLPASQIMALADDHTLAVQAWLSSRSPQALIREDGYIAASSTGIPVPLLNLALGGELPSDFSALDVSQEIDRVRQFFAARGVPWLWWISPRHARVEQQLKGSGFAGKSLPAMVAPLPSELPAMPASVHVWQAQSQADLQAASLIRRTAFRFPPETAVDYFDAMSSDWLAGDPARLYLACREGGPPAAIGALIMGASYPGVYVMATLPDHGRQGLGKVILTRIMEDAARDGHRLIVLTASTQGIGLYRQFGFEVIFNYEIYAPPPV